MSDHLATKEVADMEFLTPAEIAKILQVSSETVRQSCRSGSLPAIRLKSHYRIRRQDFEAWLERQAVIPENHASDDDEYEEFMPVVVKK